jgi:hypothetical protein
MDKFDRRNP